MAERGLRIQMKIWERPPQAEQDWTEEKGWNPVMSEQDQRKN